MDTSKRKINMDVFIGIALALFSLYLLFETYSIKVESARFPRLIILLLLALSVVVIILGIRKTVRPEIVPEDESVVEFKIIRIPLIVFLMISVYIALINFIGFYLSTLLFIPVFMYYYGIKSIKTILLTDVLLNVFVYVLFSQMLNVILP